MRGRSRERAGGGERMVGRKEARKRGSRPECLVKHTNTTKNNDAKHKSKLKQKLKEKKQGEQLKNPNSSDFSNN